MIINQLHILQMDSTSNLGVFFDFVHPFPSLLKLTLAISSYTLGEPNLDSLSTMRVRIGLSQSVQF